MPVFVVACGGGGEGRITVFAAISLRGALDEAVRQFEEDNPGLEVDLQFAGSQQLRLQVEQGARADVFISADERHMRALIEGEFVEGEPVIVARNRLALAVPFDNPGGVETWRDLARPGVRFDRAAPVVPLGAYTDQVLERMAAEADSEFAERVRDNTVSEEDSAERVLAQVRLGEIDAAFIYASDAKAGDDELRVVPFPDEFNPVVAYLAGVLRDAEGEGARAFLTFLLSGRGQRILVEHGFERVE